MPLVVYILLLEHSKYYIGKTYNKDFRLDQHFNKNGSTWTKLHKPLNIVKVIENCDHFDEDKYTLIYMNKYGIDNVRGGSFCEQILSSNTLSHINIMLKTANNECYNCGEEDHVINECKNKGTKKEKKVEYYKFDYKPYQQKTYEECVNKLKLNEHIIKKIIESDSYSGQYRVIYLTDFGNIIQGEFINGIIRVDILSTNRNIQYSEKIFKNLLKLQFKTNRISKIKQELTAYIDIINSIE